MHKGFLRASAFLGAVSVTLGAFAAHQLKSVVADGVVQVFYTGVQYQFYHVFALLAVAILYKEYRNSFMRAAGILFIIGIIFFSGSLYLLTYKDATLSSGFKWVWPFTPIGGVFFITGWLCLALGIRK
jgi:uncharacterized membrane protein YgdD (TMEM256/DUF423 family)